MTSWLGPGKLLTFFYSVGLQQLSVARVNAAAGLAAAHHLFITYSSPCFSVQIVHNYALRVINRKLIHTLICQLPPPLFPFLDALLA
jgi:hypothetical protein